jgi:hypothetical protein
MTKTHNIFISWSGERSKFIAEALKDWLPHVLQSARPWLSTRDIEKGTRSLSEMNKALGGMGFGVTCLTSENLDAPWILYEAGALSKAFDDDKGRLWTYLLSGLQPQDVEPPLSQFQHTRADEEDTRKLIHSINVAIHREEDRLQKELVDETFNRWWPELASKITTMPQAEKTTKAKRDSNDILTEILDLCRQYLPQIDARDNGSVETIPVSAIGQPTGRIFEIPKFEMPLLSSKRTFHVKLSNDGEIREILGTRAFEPHTRGLVILDNEKVVARFNDDVEMWW